MPRPNVSRGTGALPDEPDYRDIPLSAAQKPLGAPDSYAGIEAIINQLPHFDQKRLTSCVEHAIAKLCMAYTFRSIGAAPTLSPRFGWKIVKKFDGVPPERGTFPRVGAVAATKYGFCQDGLLPNNTSLSQAKYLDVELSVDMLNDGQRHKMPPFAYVDADLEAVKEAIFQNGAVLGSMLVGNWDKAPVKPSPNGTGHYTIWYRYEKTSDGDTLIYFDNSWGADWPNNRQWVYPGRGTFKWSEYAPYVRSIIAFAPIPDGFLNYVKTMPYRFAKELGIGTRDLSVFELQKALNADPETALSLEGPGSADEETGYFGTATREALKRWQQRNGVPPTGYFGPISIAKMNERIPKTSLVDALILVESGGDDMAIGDRTLTHKAYGCLQIRQPYMDDVNRKMGTNHKAEECLGNRELSIQTFKDYMDIYEPYGGDEERARCHNAGPGWRRNRALTDSYWQKVRRLLN